MEWTSHLRPGVGAHGLRALAEYRRGEDIAGLVDEGAGEVLRGGDDEPLFEAGLNLGAGSVFGFVGKYGHEVDGGVLAVALVGVVVNLAELGAFDEGAGHESAGKGLHVFVGESVVLGKRDGELTDAAGFEGADGCSGAFADLIDREGLDPAQADDEQALSLDA